MTTTRTADAGLNLMRSACCGCHIVDETSEWIVASSEVDVTYPEHEKDEEEEEEDPDDYILVQRHAWTDENGKEVDEDVLSVTNVHPRSTMIVYLSLLSDVKKPLIFLSRSNEPIRTGMTTTSENVAEPKKCVTLVLKIRPRYALIPLRIRTETFEMSILAFKYAPHADPLGQEQKGGIPIFPCFPLRRRDASAKAAFLCTQGFGGRLTHFYPQSHHAVDFQCAVGTDVVAVADGVVTDVCQRERVTGIYCQNLTSWNSVSIKVCEGEYIVDYVHIAPKSATVKVGDVVKAGDLLCQSGSVGFSPEPHLHLEVHRADDPQGPSVKFEISTDSPKGVASACGDFLAGKYYGECPRC